MPFVSRIDRAILNAVRAGQTSPSPVQLASALHYAVTPGGARIRPTILMSVAAACGDDTPPLDDAAAAALELIHCASLVHDDVPSFDDADVRRGKPSLHRAYSEPLAVLAGDRLIVMACDVLAQDLRQLVRSELARSTGAVAELGQSSGHGRSPPRRGSSVFWTPTTLPTDRTSPIQG